MIFLLTLDVIACSKHGLRSRYQQIQELYKLQNPG